MPKILACILLSSFSLSASAQYLIKIPLEVSFGGHLPDSSIIIVKNGTTPNPYPDPSDPKPPVVVPPVTNKPTLYTTFFPGQGRTLYNGNNGILLNDSIGFRIFVENSGLKTNQQYSMFGERGSCVVTTSACTWGGSAFSGGCGVNDSKITNGPKMKITVSSGVCDFDNGYQVKIREL